MMLLLLSVLFFGIAVAASVIFYRRLREARNAYEQSKDAVGGIYSSYRRQVDEQNRKIDQLATRIGILEGKVVNLAKLSGQISSRLEELAKEVRALSTRHARPKPPQRVLPSKVLVAPTHQGVLSLTDTEALVLKTLVQEGPKTTSEIREIIGKSREHTARLMKELYEEGYVERDTYHFPYVYRPRKGVKDLLERR
ncbi:TPA: MarR family transcriptional regulator [Candidatus Bathyarchaeota archaeon]|nr:MarR family transcriptional regulator [Candidatus Bathyarchaeota archaeon]